MHAQKPLLVVCAKRFDLFFGTYFGWRRVVAVQRISTPRCPLFLDVASLAFGAFSPERALLVVGTQLAFGADLEQLSGADSIGYFGHPTNAVHMSSEGNAKKRLAVSRALLVEALRDPVWLILVQRLLKEKSAAKSSAPSKQS